jgi:hypothetical protein
VCHNIKCTRLFSNKQKWLIPSLKGIQHDTWNQMWFYLKVLNVHIRRIVSFFADYDDDDDDDVLNIHTYLNSHQFIHW